jgi:6-phosphogluconolactonase (cycloisomerase 2 family)
MSSVGRTLLVGIMCVISAAGGIRPATALARGSLYVANYAGGMTISQYTIEDNGELTPKTPATVPSESPTHITVSPDGRYA